MRPKVCTTMGWFSFWKFYMFWWKFMWWFELSSELGCCSYSIMLVGYSWRNSFAIPFSCLPSRLRRWFFSLFLMLFWPMLSIMSGWTTRLFSMCLGFIACSFLCYLLFYFRCLPDAELRCGKTPGWLWPSWFGGPAKSVLNVWYYSLSSI